MISGSAGIDIKTAHPVSIFDAGAIIGTGGTAIQFAGSGNTLTLGAGYVIDGIVDPSGKILSAVRPGLVTTGGLLAIISSPYARRGEAWEAYRTDYGPAGDRLILVAHGTSPGDAAGLGRCFHTYITPSEYHVMAITHRRVCAIALHR